MASAEIHPAGRACASCGEPLSIYRAEDRCLRCYHSYKLKPMNPLQRKVTAAKRTNALLARVANG